MNLGLPPPDPRADLRETIIALQARAADLVAAHPAFAADVVLASAAELKRDIEKAGKAADAARRKEKQPHDDAGKAVQAFWVPLITRMDTAAAELDGKMKAELSRRKAVKDAAERAVREEAERLTAEAMKASEVAFETLVAVSSGEVVDANHLEARAAAEETHNAAKIAAAEAERIAKQSAGVRVAGAVTVHIKTVRKVRLALPPRTAPRAARAAALLDLMECLSENGSGTELMDTMLRLANRVYREAKRVPPHCLEYDEEKVV